MKLNDVKKSTPEKDVMKEYVDKEPQFRKESKSIQEEQKESKPSSYKQEMFKKPSRFQRMKVWQERRWVTKMEKEAVKQRMLQKKLTREQIKTQIAEQKAMRRAKSPLKGIGEKMFTKPDVRRATSQAQVRLKQQQVMRDREVLRRKMEEEREYDRKFPVRPEGDGELPYYEKEHKRPLPVKEKPKEQKKTTLKEALF